MSQYNSRILIQVKNIEDWSKLGDIDFKEFGFYQNPFDGHDQKIFFINGDWSCFEDELLSLANTISEKIPDCMLLGDTTNINVDPYAFIVYYLGEFTCSDELEGDFQWETYLDEPFDWFKAADVNLNDQQRKYLAEFGLTE